MLTFCKGSVINTEASCKNGVRPSVQP